MKTYVFLELKRLIR